MRARSLTVVVLALCAVIAGLVPAHATTVSQHYTAGFISDVADSICKDDPMNPTGQNIGGACFQVTPGKTAHVVVNDDVQGTSVGYFWALKDQYGNLVFGGTQRDRVTDATTGCTDCGFACARSVNVRIITGAVSLVVAPDGPVIGPVDCTSNTDSGSLGFGTTGLITVDQT